MNFKLFNKYDLYFYALLILFFFVGDVLTTIIGIYLGYAEKVQITKQIIENGIVYFILFKILITQLLIILNYIMKEIRKYILEYENVFTLLLWDNLYNITGIFIGVYATLNNLYVIL